MVPVKPKKTQKEYVAAIEKAGSGSHTGFGGTWSGGYCVQQVPDELAWLYGKLADRGVGRYCEIGVAAGGFTRLLYEQVGFDHAWLLDNGLHWHFKKQTGNLAKVPHTRFVGDSHSPEARAFLQKSCDVKLDTVFVDGDHSEAGVLQDIKLVLPHCRSDAWVILHDSHFSRHHGKLGSQCHVPTVAGMIREGKIDGLVALDEYASSVNRIPCGIMVCAVQ